MARYIDADKFRQELIFKQLYCGDDTAERHALGIVIAELDGTPTVDVVPKSEVEKFAEDIKLEFYREFDEIIPSIMADKIDELKKKYTEGDQ